MAATRQAKKSRRPRPPDELDRLALVEFHRVCDVLDEEGRLDTADTALIALYAQTWATYFQAAKGVARNGHTEVYSNGNTGLSADFKAMKELGRLIRGLLRDLDLAPGPRGKSDMDVGDFEF